MEYPQQQKAKLERLPRVILAIPDDDGFRDLGDALHRAGFIPHRTPTAETTALAVTYRSPVAVFLDASLVASAGFRFFDSLRLVAPGIPVIVIADAADEELRLRALTLGAEDCLARPFAPQEAVLRLRRALDRRQVVRDLGSRREEAAGRIERDKSDIGALRAQLHRSVTLLQRAVDFHQRLEPGGDAAGLQALFLRNLSVQIGVDRLVYLGPSHTDASWFTARASWGIPQRLTERMRIPARGELVKLLEATGSPFALDRVRGLPGLRLESGILAAGGFGACVPLLQKGGVFGLIALGEMRTGGAPDDERLRLAHFLSSALVPTLSAQDRWSRERHISAETLRFLVSCLEARSPYLRGHSLRVARLAEGIGLRLGMSDSELSRLTTSALLHDIGRFEVDVAFWSKEGPLGPEDWKLIRRHPGEGARILGEASWPEPVLDAVRYHHERWDGSGYPRGLHHQAIPWNARIVAVADAMEALTSPRPQRPARSPAEALDLIRSVSGADYDPAVVDLLEIADGAGDETEDDGPGTRDDVQLSIES